MCRVVRRRASAARLGGLTALLVLATGCGGVGEPAPYPPTGVDGLEVPTPSPDPADFVEGVDNPLLPLTPGTRWRYEVREDGELVETIDVTVEEETRTVAGVEATVVHDVVHDAEGTMLEDTFDWFAQDTDGNVWYLGEDTTAYEDGVATEEGSWEAGVDGALAGLVMPASPRVGDGFQQEYLEGEAEDRGRIVDTAASRTTAYGAWDDLLETEDTTPLEPDLVEHKFYARDLGMVLEENRTDGEVVELVEWQAG